MIVSLSDASAGSLLIMVLFSGTTIQLSPAQRCLCFHNPPCVLKIFPQGHVYTGESGLATFATFATFSLTL